MNSRDQMLRRIETADGFIAALDQSGGSTPAALRMYGVGDDTYSGEREMLSRIHEMRTRILTSESFGSGRILGAILFEDTMDREVGDTPTAHYLCYQKGVVPFVKVDRGLAAEAEGVRVMKPIPELDALLDRALKYEVFGTKMRSVIVLANADGIEAVVNQQFQVAKHILARGLVPIIEPEVDIQSPDKEECEVLLRNSLLRYLDGLSKGERVMLKLTLPSQDGFYRPCIGHPNTLRVVALSGGYSREQANRLLARNHGMIASFSRALTEGLTTQQSDEEFDAVLDGSIQSIFEASRT